jgi:hypothetical protein
MQNTTVFSADRVDKEKSFIRRSKGKRPEH